SAGIYLSRHPALSAGSLGGSVGQVKCRDPVFIDQPLNCGTDFIRIHDRTEIAIRVFGSGADTLGWDFPTLESIAFAYRSVRSPVPTGLVKKVANIQTPITKKVPLRFGHQRGRVVRAFCIQKSVRSAAVVQRIGSNDFSKRSNVCVYGDR